ncbi:MAG: hypothetical protein NTZ94_14945, partial [Verrucomicrobia bacterium]|nr:hypothetical protein [Verrucomicrobiota bacterium]
GLQNDNRLQAENDRDPGRRASNCEGLGRREGSDLPGARGMIVVGTPIPVYSVQRLAEGTGP